MPPYLATRRRPLLLNDIIGFSGDSLGDQLRREPARWLRPAVVPPEPEPLVPSGIIMGHGVGGGREWEFVPRDPNFPSEIPEQIKRRAELADTWSQNAVPDYYRDPAAAQFPVNSLGVSVNSADYNKGPLDVGYERPAVVPPPATVPIETPPDVRTMPTIAPTRAQLGPPPPMALVRNGRPARVIAMEGTPEDREAAYLDRVQGFQPQKESKKHLALRALLSIPFGGLVGAGETLLGPGGAFDRRGLDRSWQEGEVAKAQKRLGGYREQRRDALRDELLGAQVEETRAEAEQRRNPRDQTKYDWIPNPADPNGSDIYAPLAPNMVRPVRPRAVSDRPPLIHTRQNRDGSTSTLLSYDQGRTWSESPELTSQPPPKPPAGTETPEQYRARVGQFRAAQKLFNDLSSQEQIAAKRKDDAYARASTLRDWRAKGIAGENGMIPTADDITVADKAAQQAQADYASYAEKKTKAQADMLQYGDVDEKGEPREPRQSVAPTTSPRITEQQIRDAAKAKGLDPDRAVARARRRRML